MKWFKNLNATPRLMASFGVLLVLTLGISYLAISNLSKANDRVDSLYHEDMIGLTNANGITIDVALIKGDDLNALFRAANPDAVASSEKDELVNMADLHANLDAADKLFVTKKGMDQLGIIRRALPDYERAQADLFNAIKSKNMEAIQAPLAAAVEYRTIILNASDVARSLKQAHADEQFQVNSASYQSARTLLISAAAVSLILGMILSIVIARGFSVPLGLAVEALEKVADGDLTATLDVETKDEVGRMATALNRAVEKLMRDHAGGSRQRRQRQRFFAATGRRVRDHRLRAPRSRQPASKRLQRAWKRLPRQCGKAPTTPTRPASLQPARRTPPCKARRWFQTPSPR